MLCRFHHRLVHDHGWQLLVHHGHWVAVDPHGTHWTGRPTTLPATTTGADPPDPGVIGGSPTRPTHQTHR